MNNFGKDKNNSQIIQAIKELELELDDNFKIIQNYYRIPRGYPEVSKKFFLNFQPKPDSQI